MGFQGPEGRDLKVSWGIPKIIIPIFEKKHFGKKKERKKKLLPPTGLL